MSKKTHSADSNSDIEWSIEAMKQAFYDASEHCEEVYKELNKQNEIKKMDSKDLKNLTEEYSKISEAYTVTKADKKGNTPAYQGYIAGKKNIKTGEPLYKAADHMESLEDAYLKVYEEKAPRMQKGAMAYDGPNKPASEAKDRIIAKTKKKAMERKDQAEKQIKKRSGS